MKLSGRQKELLAIISEAGYVSVEELAKKTFTSPSSIRRDLANMQNLGLVKRTHGGVSLPEMNGSVAGFYNRSQKNVKEKRLIAARAAALLKNGQSILLDSSSTASFLLPHIAKLEGATVFTNNLETAVSALKLGISTHCIGGYAINGSVSLGGTQAYKALSDINVDILFFSSQALSREGVISDATEAENFVRLLMLGRARTTVFLCDSEKFNTSSLHTLTTLDSIDFAVFDKPFEGLSTTATIL